MTNRGKSTSLLSNALTGELFGWPEVHNRSGDSQGIWARGGAWDAWGAPIRRRHTALALARDVQPEDAATSPTIHSLRLGGRPGDHAVHFGLPDETLTLAHSAHSRGLFAAGALLAARWVVTRRPGSYDMQSVLFANPTSAGS